jgi:predicted dehydrogenase
MQPLRLAICGLEAEAQWADVARRLHGPPLDVCVGPPRPGREEVARFLEAGRHVLAALEPCWPPDQLEALAGAAQRSGVRFAVVNPDRHLPSRQLIKQQVPGKLGEVGLVRVHRWGPAGPLPEPLGLPGPLVRDLDVVLWLSDLLPDVVFALERPGPAGRHLQVHLGFPGGGMALLDYDDGTPRGAGYQALTVVGAAGAAYADDHQNAQLLFRDGRALAVRTGEGLRQILSLAQEWIDGLGTGTDPTAGLASWRKVFAVVEAIRQALATHRAVPLEGR